MMTLIRLLYVLVLNGALFACAERQSLSTEEIIEASLSAIGSKDIRENIKNIISEADCVGPKGKYQTIIESDDTGYTYFKQMKSYDSLQNYEAVIYDGRYGFVLADTSTALTETEIFGIKSHEFQNTLLSLDKRFHSFEITKDTAVLDNHVLKARTELDKPCHLYFNKEHHYLEKITFANPDNPSELITTKFAHWEKVNQLYLPLKVIIRQGNNFYTFEFKDVLINSAHFHKIDVHK